MEISVEVHVLRCEHCHFLEHIVTSYSREIVQVSRTLMNSCLFHSLKEPLEINAQT